MRQRGDLDESVSNDADKLIVDSLNARTHVAFGFAVHLCTGNRLAELQLRAPKEEIIKRFHTVELVDEIEHIPNNFFRRIKNVPNRLHPI